MKLIDGSEGEGGGQIIRSSLALSLVTGQPVTINNIRAKRSKPGLMRQHLTSVHAAAKIGNAAISGATLGSSKLVFAPTCRPIAGSYEFKIGTAGSTMLVLQTILLPLLLSDRSSSIALEGGTHNPLAPPFDFLQRVFVPLLQRMGATIDMKLIRPGFYPAGGGRCEITMTPALSLKTLTLLERGSLIRNEVRSIVANLPITIAERETHRALEHLEWPPTSGKSISWSNSRSPGNLIFIELDFEHINEVVSAFGERGKSAEAVADEAVAATRSYLLFDAPVGEHLADQLLLPMGLAAHLGHQGGSFRTGPLSDHSLTHMKLLRQFLDIEISVSGPVNQCVTVRID